MLPALGLGWRLATRSTKHGRLRSLIMVLVSALGTASALMIGAVMLAVQPESSSPEWLTTTPAVTLRAFTGGAILAVVLPVLIAAASAGRMSAALRERRLARLRLLGLSRRGSLLVGVGESLPWAGAGWLIGAPSSVLAAPLVSRIPVTAIPDGVVAPPTALILSSLAIPTMIVLGATLPPRRGVRTSNGRSTHSRPPALWRAFPAVAGSVLLVIVGHGSLSVGTAGILFLVGGLLVMLGVILLTPMLVRLVAEIFVRIDHPVATVAGRRLQGQPAALARPVGALMVGLVVATGAQALILAFETLPQYASVRYDQEVESRAVASLPGDATAPALREYLEDVPGIRDIAVVHSADAPGLAGTQEGEGVTVIISSCAELKIVDPTLQGCRDDRPAWVVDLDNPRRTAPTSGMAEVYESREGSQSLVTTVPIDAWEITGGPYPDSLYTDRFTGSLFVPRSLLNDAEIATFTDASATFTADPRAGFVSELRAAGIDAYNGLDMQAYQQWTHTKTMLRMFTAIILTLGLGSFLLGTLDRVIERRPEMARLRVLGTPVRALRAAHALEVIPPLLIGCALAVLMGGLVGEAMVSLWNRSAGLGTQIALPPGTVVWPILAAAGGSAVIALITSTGLGSRVDTAMIRRA